MRTPAALAIVVAACSSPQALSEQGETTSTASTTAATTFWSSSTTEASTGPPRLPEPTAFLLGPDGGSVSIGCDIWAQDCPAGEKCMPWADGGGSWNATACSPIADDPGRADDPCTVEGSGVSGVDDCALGLMCWDVDHETNMGTCVPMCLGTESSAHCADPDRACSVDSQGVVALCLPKCHPVEQDCREGQGCYPVSTYFVCAADATAATGAHGDACEYLNACDPGLFFLGADFVCGSCNPASFGCCAVVCTVGFINPCPGEGEDCVPWFEPPDAPPHYDDVGVCILRQ